jgi:CheY-like chemotaxis protein
VDEAVNLLKATLPARVELEVEVSANAPHILADATQIQQVFLNLVTNGAQALEGRAGRVHVRVESVEFASAANTPAGLKPGRYARVSVTDTGKGMDAPTLQRIYDPFFTTKGPGEGTGLGLSVVHGIVQNHEGIILATSQPGSGTTFRIYFPAVEPIQKTPVDDNAAPGPAKGDGRRVLCLDDEEPLLLIAEHMLKRLGYEPLCVSKPEDALKVFRENPSAFEILMTDLNMPRISGLEIAEEILKLQPQTVVVMCSGYVTDQLKAQAERLGIRHILHKPYTLEELGACMQSAIVRS